MARKIAAIGTEIRILTMGKEDFISLTDMLKAKDSDFFISDWLRNRNTVEFLGIWERVHNPDFNYGEFAAIRGSHKLKGNSIAIQQMKLLTDDQMVSRQSSGDGSSGGLLE